MELMGNEQEDWRAWFREQSPAMVLFARQFARTLADAEDAVQEGFVRFWRSRSQTEDGRAYLYACVRNAALDQARGRRRRELREQSAASDRPPAMLACPVEQEERRHRVEDAMAALPANQREVLALKVWADLTFKQIAALYGIPIDTAASRYRYALDALRRRLGEESKP
jgi:RNA polymerase sigma-70 factor, ECF subfamily